MCNTTENEITLLFVFRMINRVHRYLFLLPIVLLLLNKAVWRGTSFSIDFNCSLTSTQMEVRSVGSA